MASKSLFFAYHHSINHLLGIEFSLELVSLSRLPCLLIICIFRTLSASESVLLIMMVSSASTALERDCRCCEELLLGGKGGRLSVNDSSTFSWLGLGRRRAGIWTLTTISSFLGGGLGAFDISSKSGVDDHELGLCRSRNGAVISMTFSGCVERFEVDVQLLTVLSSPSLFKLGEDAAMSSPRRAPCSL